MELIAFRVRMYKGIIDSEWVDVKSLTVFVGKNESGKTSLLKALHKLNPYNPEPYEMAKEWPRGRRRERSERHVVCRAKFRLSNQEKSKLAQIAERETFPDIVKVSRDYAGDLKVDFDGEVFSDKRHPQDVDNAFNVLPELLDEFGIEFEQCANKCIEEAKVLALEGRFAAEFQELAEKHEELLRDVQSLSDSSQQIEEGFINDYTRELWDLEEQLEELPSIQTKVHKYVIDCLPTFIYMDDYRAFSGTAQLNEIQSRQDDNSLTEEDKTFLTILNLSALKLDELVQLGQGAVEAIEQPAI